MSEKPEPGQEPEHEPELQQQPEPDPEQQPEPDPKPERNIPTATPVEPDRKPATKTGFSWKNQPPPSRARIMLWVVVGGIGLYYLGSGIIGLLTH